MFDADADRLDARVEHWANVLEDRARRAADLAAQVRDLRVDASIGRGMVTATVDQGGHLTDLKLDERVRDWPATRIAQGVLAATDAARQALAAHILELTTVAGFGDADR
ncbi:YbaB/EbfC family nucleoid-associated protein [Catellatospora methionotrophica]|uniref:YbaB/EbfC family nucleoid-associated protein n=1 Tax=Catellatospora methionotrophica TaxID=121620 RepID=UPI0033E5C8AB